MPMGGVQVAARKSTAITNAGSRLEVAEIKKLIHDSGVCRVAVEMARTGLRPVFDDESEKVVMEPMSEAAHVEMVKFIANKVLPNAKDHETVDDKKAIDAWAEVIQAEDAKELVKV